MDNGGSRFAIGLLILWGAFILLFIALHHNGIPNANNPGDALKWLINEFQSVTGLSDTGDTSTSDFVPTPSGQPSVANEVTK
jgi:hypothetical protein